MKPNTAAVLERDPRDRHQRAWQSRRGADPVSAFWGRADKSGGPIACWPWTGNRTASGYGQFNGAYTHRIAHELGIGPIPDGLMVCHRCDNPPCVNPAHLYAGTAADNMRDAIERGLWRKPRSGWATGARQRPNNTHCKRGHPYDGTRAEGWKLCRTCRSINKRARRLRLRDLERATGLAA